MAGLPVGGRIASAAPEGECCVGGIVEDVDGDQFDLAAFFCRDWNQASELRL